MERRKKRCWWSAVPMIDAAQKRQIQETGSRPKDTVQYENIFGINTLYTIDNFILQQYSFTFDR